MDISVLVQRMYLSNSVSWCTCLSFWHFLQLHTSCTLQDAIDHNYLHNEHGTIYLCYRLLSALVPWIFLVIQLVTTLAHNSGTSYDSLQVAPYRLQLTTNVCVMNMVQSTVATIPYIHWYHRWYFITPFTNYLNLSPIAPLPTLPCLIIVGTMVSFLHSFSPVTAAHFLHNLPSGSILATICQCYCPL